MDLEPLVPSHEQIVACVDRLRAETIVGACIDMVPYGPADDAEVVRLRSLPNVRHFMNLTDQPSLTAQRAWRAGYETRSNDVMWMIRDKCGRVCGTNRLYDIGVFSAEKGSQIVDPQFSRILPAALEADITVIKIAFQQLGMDRVVAFIREDNAHVRSMNERFGFEATADEMRNEVRYIRYCLQRDRWKSDSFDRIVKHWSKRF